MNRNTKILLTVISLLLIVLTTLPYIYGWIIRPANTVYLGNGLFNPHDNHVYYAYIEQAKTGHWLFQDVFTTEPHQPFLHLFWLIIGLMAKVLSLSSILAFHLARILLIPLFVFTVWLFLNKAWENDGAKEIKIKIALLIFFFTSGLGGLMMLFKYTKLYPPEVWWPEAYAFLSIYSSPHFIASWICIIASVYFYILGIQTKNYKKIIWGGLIGAFLTQWHTFYLALLLPLVVIFFFYIYKKRDSYLIKYTLLYLLFFVPVILYYFILIKSDWVMNKRLMDNLMLTPFSLPILLFTFGFLFFFALFALILFNKKNKANLFQSFLLIWLLITPFLLYSSLPFERRLIEGWQLPVVFFAVEILYLIYKNIKNKTEFWFIFFLLFFLSNILINVLFFTVFHQRNENREYYLPLSIQSAFVWLKQTDPEFNKIIFSSPLTSISATFLADKKIFLGHSFETIEANNKKIIWLNFINSNNNDVEKKQFLKKWKIDYIVWGPYELLLSPKFNPSDKEYLKEIYNNDGVKIFKVN